MMSSLSMQSTYKTLDGHSIPIIGIGLHPIIEKGEVEQAFLEAIRNGYRLIDTAEYYENEEEIASAIKKCGVPREELYIITKLWDDSHGREKATEAFHRILKKLDLQYIDCLLIHSVLGGKVVETWDAMIDLQVQGLVRTIGVANFGVDHLEELKKARPDVIPAVNQIEVTPFHSCDAVVEYCKNAGILIQAYYPLSRGNKLEDCYTVQVAKRYMKSTTQLLIRWSLQSGFVCIPKSAREERTKHFKDVFDFHITEKDIDFMNNQRHYDLMNLYDPMKAEWQS